MLKGHVAKTRGRHDRGRAAEAVRLGPRRQIIHEPDVVDSARGDGDFHGKSCLENLLKQEMHSDLLNNWI